MVISLKYELREKNQSPVALRNEGKMPAVFYGRKQESRPITLSLKEFEKIWKKAGESSIVNLIGKDDEVQALIHDVDRHPVTGVPRHADFYVFEKGQKLKIKVPIEFIGVAPAVKDLGGVLVKVAHELEIEAAPKDLPQKVEADISTLNTFDSVVTAKEIKLPSGVSLAVSPEDVIASVYEPKEEAAVEAPPVDLSSIEVVKKGKEAAEGEESVAAAEAPKTEAPKEEKKK